MVKVSYANLLGLANTPMHNFSFVSCVLHLDSNK